MLAQFQSLYPNGSLISELVQIFQGKYIVRASVQIEGVTRATGMAAAETVEVAEDQARNRALMVLGMQNTPQTPVVSSPQPELQIQTQTNPTSHESTYTSAQDGDGKDQDFASNQWSITSNDSQENPNRFSNTPETYTIPKSDTQNLDFHQSLLSTGNHEPELNTAIEDLPLLSAKQPENLTVPEIAASNVTPFTPRSYSQPENVTNISGTGKKKKKAEPVDLSDVIAKTDVELQRLGWTPEQGREYLIKTYGKRGRTLLTEDELHSFLKHLESQPDPIAGF
ncbi:hypothetical protein [Nostoc sp. TCL26-01]|uniref:hypothetical protein n=1 Tax=Nostoc sp. TCL26-01 TaxID=2576904 RepID=UPI0015C03B91|nr:hypothetical protein [Nostoc sp. TCL26-01]QLE57785.1 hypothetical protein FD725_21065 [Nostoc sp. TCL26-01]